MDWVSFDEIKKMVTLHMVINHYGIPLRKVGSHILRGKCPLPTHQSKESKESFIATLDKGTGGAWACHSDSCASARGGKRGGNVLDFVAAMERCSVRDAAIKLQTWFLLTAVGSPSPADKEPGTELVQEPLARSSRVKEPKTKLISENRSGAGESESNKPLTFALQKIDHMHPYLNERGISEETARTFGVGFFSGKGSMQNRLVIPIHNAEGELLAYAGRAIDGSEPRYRFPAGFHKSREIFNLHRVIRESSVILVEGFFDCMKVTQAGFACVALMGATMSKVQEDLLAKHFGQVVVMLDGDEKGREVSPGIVDRLQRIIYQVGVITLPDGMQPDQLVAEQICNEVKRIMRRNA